VNVDVANKVAVVFLGLFLAAFIWWVLGGQTRERRRTAAEARMRAQTALDAVEVEMGKHRQTEDDEPTRPIPLQCSGKHHFHGDDALTVPLLLERAEQEIDPLVVRPYMQDDLLTKVIPAFRGR
jgi:cbb3-type cytochrome oxidase subunit 3